MGLTSSNACLVVWAVSDGRAGIEAQSLGLAEAVARRRPAEITVKRIEWRRPLGGLPWRLNPFPRSGLSQGSSIAPPWPDLWIAAGRATLPLSTRVRRWSGGRTFVVQTQDPRTASDRFDLVVPPLHDRLTGPNVLPIIGSPNRVTPERITEDLARFAQLVSPLVRPRIGVLIGGRSRAFDLPPERAAAMGDEIAAAVMQAGGSILATFSRRTPEPARAVLASRLEKLPGVIWDGTGDNPYFAFLGGADHLLATEDSVNIATEAASTGKPVHILAMTGGSPKFTRFHEGLRAHGASRPFTGAFETWTYPPLAESDRAAVEVLRRLDAC